MTKEQALQIASESRMARGKQAISGYEYNSYFVFDFQNSPDGKALDSLIGVDKKTGKACVFTPLMISINELNSGKRFM